MSSFGDTHEFAFYSAIVRHIVQYKSNLDIYTIEDEQLAHRISTVLRLQKGTLIILFDSHFHIKCSIIAINNKKSLTVELHEITHNEPLKPKISWLLPILKREAFEEAIYSLTELGAQVIQPILTEKNKKTVITDKEEFRIKRIMIAAAEQSKQFILPEFHPIIPLTLWLEKIYPENIFYIFFDKSGTNLANTIELLKSKHIQEIIALTGPEGDLTHQEKISLTIKGFVFSSLTKTTLRAQQAISVGLGALRSLLP